MHNQLGEKKGKPHTKKKKKARQKEYKKSFNRAI